MPNVNVYLPSDLASGLAAAKDHINVSAVCQRALREELIMLQEMKTTETERIEVDVQDQMGTVRTLAFQGRWLVEPNEDEIIDWNMYGLALTGRGRIAVWWGAPGDPATFRDFDTLEEAEAQGVPSIVIADARAILTHSTPVVELDI